MEKLECELKFIKTNSTRFSIIKECGKDKILIKVGSLTNNHVTALEEIYKLNMRISSVKFTYKDVPRLLKQQEDEIIKRLVGQNTEYSDEVIIYDVSRLNISESDMMIALQKPEPPKTYMNITQPSTNQSEVTTFFGKKVEQPLTNQPRSTFFNRQPEQPSTNQSEATTFFTHVSEQPKVNIKEVQFLYNELSIHIKEYGKNPDLNGYKMSKGFSKIKNYAESALNKKIDDNVLREVCKLMTEQ